MIVNTGDKILGLPVEIHTGLPRRVPTDAENATRIVRWRWSELEGHRGTSPGLKRDEAIHAYIAPDPFDAVDFGDFRRRRGILHISYELRASFERGYEPRFGYMTFDMVLAPNAHGRFLLDRLYRAGVRQWNILGRAVEIPFTPKELRP